jgi:hypothetical protein
MRGLIVALLALGGCAKSRFFPEGLTRLDSLGFDIMAGMSRFFCFCLALLLTSVFCRSAEASNDPWQKGRIEDVEKTVDTKTLYWIANTPITKDEITYTISVHLDDELVIASYQPDKAQDAPPEQWTKDRPVKVDVEGDYMFLKVPDGHDLKLRIFKRKRAAPMRPVRDAELAEAYTPPDTKPAESLIGFSSSAQEKSRADAPAEVPHPEEPKIAAGTIGTVSITTVPYLAEVYVDGKSVGYSPAKLSLPAGKHTLRFEKAGYKPQSKEVTVLADSDFTVYATLEKK